MNQVAGGAIPPDDVTIETNNIGRLQIKALTSDNISVLTGTVGHGGQIPLPAGYTQAQCVWFVSIYSLASHGENAAGGDNNTMQCYTDANRNVTCRTLNGAAGTLTGTANYLIIGVK